MKYSQLLAVVYKRMGENWGAPAPWEECTNFANSLKMWEPFPDTVPALKYLKQSEAIFTELGIEKLTATVRQEIKDIENPEAKAEPEAE